MCSVLKSGLTCTVISYVCLFICYVGFYEARNYDFLDSFLKCTCNIFWNSLILFQTAQIALLCEDILKSIAEQKWLLKMTQLQDTGTNCFPCVPDPLIQLFSCTST